jgi:Raf kinase inhibitor-like YbhB/YbcL family protein
MASLRFVFATLVLVGCGKQLIAPRPPSGAAIASITVTSRAFGTNSPIPIEHTCDGRELMPPVTWSAPPEGTKSLAFVVEDPDVSSGTFTHFIAFNLAAETTSLKETADLTAAGATLGANDFGNVLYNGPCPPKGEAHRYRFRIVALNAPLKLNEGATREQLDAAMDGHVLGEGHLTGYFVH